MVSSAAYEGDAYKLFGTALLGAVYSPAGKGNPPHVKFDHPSYIASRAIVGHHQKGYGALHCRRAKWIGRKAGRMNGDARRVMGATWHANRDGYYPDWDPLQRHPTLADINEGADYVGSWF
jgi:hypothetical protein